LQGLQSFVAVGESVGEEWWMYRQNIVTYQAAEFVRSDKLSEVIVAREFHIDMQKYLFVRR